MQNSVFIPEKNFQQTGNRKEFLHTNKGICEMSRADIILHSERLNL